MAMPESRVSKSMGPDPQGPEPGVVDAGPVVLTEGQVRRLAEVLGHAFRITEGAALVWVLGSGSERDNREALVHWVRGQVLELDSEVAGALLPVLLKRLERVLKEWEDGL